ncbi:hypothetical protein [Nocardia sp. CC213A]|uniref:hypothetical protein n=1 Tax=Nocardia sp. CC213A TaxID=3044157 RepID=UPI00278BD403|nr:hypothetical protein [Nocardia sp. CC213A]
MTTTSPQSSHGSDRGPVPKTVRPMLLATFAKAELMENVPDITPHIHASQSS